MKAGRSSQDVGVAAELFANVDVDDFLDFMDNGRLNYRQVSDFLEFDKSELSKIARISKSSVRLDERIPKDLRDRLYEIASVCNLVASYFDGNPEKTALWFRLPNPMLGGATPRDMLRLGRYKRLLQYVQYALSQNQSAA